MERYLKDEPKLHSYKIKAELDTPWDLFATPSRILEELNYNEHNLDSLSTSSMSSACSGVSWDSTLSCAVVVKKEKIEDDEDNSDSYEDNFCKIPIQIKTENELELRLLARAGELLPTLTPPSSPESIRTAEAELALLGHQGLFNVSSSHLPRSAIARLTAAAKNSLSLSRYIQASQNIPSALTHRTTTDLSPSSGEVYSNF